MNAIYASNLTKNYKNLTAVDHVTLAVSEGECFALLGINGAGKTTLIRMLSCLSEQTSGEASILGHSITNEQSVVKKLIGISPQDTAVAENLTTEENLKFMAELFLKKSEIEPRVEEIIHMIHLEEVRKKRTKTLSDGWKRKLSIAMAIIGKPKVLFLDEPTLGLDVLARRDLWKEIETLKSEMTIVLTTHYMEEAENLADRIAIMIDGRIKAVGSLKELEIQTRKQGLEEVFISLAESNCH